LLKHIAFWRSRERREHRYVDHGQFSILHSSSISQCFCFANERSIFQAIAGRGLVFFENRNRDIDLGEESSTRKLVVGVLVALGSFSASTPHFFLNVLTVFSCSISLVSLVAHNCENATIPTN
jgi:hypothetical protein